MDEVGERVVVICDKGKGGDDAVLPLHMTFGQWGVGMV